MVLPYLGTLKTLLYLPILTYLDVTVQAVRLPFLLIGAMSVWLFFAILERVCGRARGDHRGVTPGHGRELCGCDDLRFRPDRFAALFHAGRNLAAAAI